MTSPERLLAEPLRVWLWNRLSAQGFDAHSTRQLADMPWRTLVVEPRRPFREPGEPLEEIILVNSGLLCKYKGDGVGRREIVSLRFPGDRILSRAGTAHYGIQAIVRSEVSLGSAEDFDAIADMSPSLQQFLRRSENRHTLIGYEWLVNRGRREAIARVAHLLCETVERSGIDPQQGGFHNPFTQQHIADMTGQTSVNVNRVFAMLEQKNLIIRSGRTIWFRDWHELCRVGSFHPEYLK